MELSILDGTSPIPSRQNIVWQRSNLKQTYYKPSSCKTVGLKERWQLSAKVGGTVPPQA